jgi:hypothetical protein
MPERDRYDTTDPDADGDVQWTGAKDGVRYRIAHEYAQEWDGQTWDGSSLSRGPLVAKILADAAELRRLRRFVSCAVQTCEKVDDSVRRSEPGPLTGPAWHKVSFLFGVGSTTATALCREFGADPDYDCHAELESEEEEDDA